MAYCDLCHVYDDEHTDGEPDMQRGRWYKPTYDYYYSIKIMGKDWCDYDWGQLTNSEGDDVTCMCQRCFNSMDRMGKITWNKKTYGAAWKCTSSTSGT